jgi:hypothetical protein
VLADASGNQARDAARDKVKAAKKKVHKAEAKVDQACG